MPAAPLAFMLLFASNFFSVITPQGSSANLLFTGKRISHPGRALPPGRDHDRHQPAGVSRCRHPVAAGRGPLTGHRSTMSRRRRPCPCEHITSSAAPGSP
ncbi:MAG: hypothetical protein MZV64_05120 [Ignavibacteriales bacterium]|nr:hypothetical protein [Ignavibacteriales bacterium]